MDESRHDAKLAYTAPEIESLGTIAEITASGSGTDGSFDGHGYTGSSGGGAGGGTHGS